MPIYNAFSKFGRESEILTALSWWVSKFVTKKMADISNMCFKKSWFFEIDYQIGQSDLSLPLYRS